MRSLWWKVAALLLPFCVTALIGWGDLRRGQNDLQAQLEKKVNADVVSVQYQTIISRLERIERKLDQ